MLYKEFLFYFKKKFKGKKNLFDLKEWPGLLQVRVFQKVSESRGI